MMLGSASSSFCAFYSRHLPQLLSDAKVSVLATQSHGLKVVKNLGTNITFPKHTKGKYTVTVAIFAVVGQLSYHCQLSFITVLLIGTPSKESIFHVISWMSHKFKDQFVQFSPLIYEQHQRQSTKSKL